VTAPTALNAVASLGQPDRWSSGPHQVPTAERGQMNGHRLTTTNTLIIAVFAAALPAVAIILIAVLASTV